MEFKRTVKWWMLPCRHRKRREVFLIFDDGPDEKFTPVLLDILDEERVKATFFLIGCLAEKHPFIVSEIVRRGHSVGSHTYRHLPPCRITVLSQVQDIVKGHQIVESVVGKNLRLFRPSFGAVTPGVILTAMRGIRPVHFTVDSNDWRIRDKEMLAGFLTELPMRDGDILLFHDDLSATIAVIQQFLKRVRSEGFSFAYPE